MDLELMKIAKRKQDLNHEISEYKKLISSTKAQKPMNIFILRALALKVHHLQQELETIEIMLQ
jgi:hypothetical protein